MDFHLRRAQVVASLPRMKSRSRGTGAIPLNPDSRLKAMSSFSPIATTSPAPSADLSAFVKDAYDQGSEDSCVAYSIAGMQSTLQQILQSQWLTFDSEELYRDSGGTGTNGISTVDALLWDRSRGLVDLASKSRHRISDFAFADPMTAEGLASMKSAITAKCPCVLALLLPSDFNEQFNGSGNCTGTITSDYHQICLVGYDDKRFTFLNSWGRSWGKNGIGTIEWSLLQDPSQAGSTYAYTITDTAQPSAKPFYLNAWTDSGPLLPSNEGWMERVKAWQVPGWALMTALCIVLLLIAIFTIIYHKLLFADGSLRIWITTIGALALLAGANRAIFSPGPGNSDPTFVRYVIAFNSVIFIVVGLATLVIFIPKWGNALFMAGASLLTGGFFGLLFGYPSGVAQQTSAPSTLSKSGGVQPRVQEKNLLAESASTLGKLITGFTLARTHDIVSSLKIFCTSVGPAFSLNQNEGKLLAAGVLAYFFATGFLSGLFLPSYFMSGKFGE